MAAQTFPDCAWRSFEIWNWHMNDLATWQKNALPLNFSIYIAWGDLCAAYVCYDIVVKSGEVSFHNHSVTQYHQLKLKVPTTHCHDYKILLVMFIRSHSFAVRLLWITVIMNLFWFRMNLSYHDWLLQKQPHPLVMQWVILCQSHAGVSGEGK